MVTLALHSMQNRLWVQHHNHIVYRLLQGVGEKVVYNPDHSHRPTIFSSVPIASPKSGRFCSVLLMRIFPMESLHVQVPSGDKPDLVQVQVRGIY
jgi:hypothetical protein